MRVSATLSVNGIAYPVELEPGSDPGPFAAAGATWGLVAFPSDPVSVDQVRGVIRDGPGRTS